MTASYGPAALACSATCRVPAMLDRSPTTTAVAAGRAARASSALAALRACSVTAWPSSVSSLAAISPRPSAEPVMSTRDMSYSLQTEDNVFIVHRSGWLAAQVLPGGVHQFEGVADVVAGQLAFALDHVAANDHRLNVGGTRSEDHDSDRVAEPVEVRGSHVDDRDISLFAWREGANLVLKVPHPGPVDGGQAQHVPLVQVHGRDLLAAGQSRRVGPGPFRGQRQAHLGEQVVAGAADGVDTEAGDDSPAKGWPGGGEGAELHQHVGGWRDGDRALSFSNVVELPVVAHVV